MQNHELRTTINGQNDVKRIWMPTTQAYKLLPHAPPWMAWKDQMLQLCQTWMGIDQTCAREIIINYGCSHFKNIHHIPAFRECMWRHAKRTPRTWALATTCYLCIQAMLRPHDILSFVLSGQFTCNDWRFEKCPEMTFLAVCCIFLPHTTHPNFPYYRQTERQTKPNGAFPG